MLDIKFIRENKDIVQAGAKKKHIEIDIDALIALDDTRLKELKEVLRGNHSDLQEIRKEIEMAKQESILLEKSLLQHQVHIDQRVVGIKEKR